MWLVNNAVGPETGDVALSAYVKLRIQVINFGRNEAGDVAIAAFEKHAASLHCSICCLKEHDPV
jgi:hypothetical protein